MVGSIRDLTTNFNFTLPEFNTVTWHDYINENFEAIDALLYNIYHVQQYKGAWKSNTIYQNGDVVFIRDDLLIENPDQTLPNPVLIATYPFKGKMFKIVVDNKNTAGYTYFSEDYMQNMNDYEPYNDMDMSRLWANMSQDFANKLDDTIKDPYGVDTGEYSAKHYRNLTQELKNDVQTIHGNTEIIYNNTINVYNDTISIKNETETLKNETETLKNDTDNIKSDVLVLKDDTNIIKQETEQIKNDVVVLKESIQTDIDELEELKEDAEQYKNRVEEIYNDLKDSVVYKYKGSVQTYNDLLIIVNKDAGDVYNVIDSGMNYAWEGTNWDALGGTFEVNLSDYYTKNETYTKEQVDNINKNKQNVLVSGTNIRTINSVSVLGSGNIDTKELLVMTTDVVMGATPALKLSKTYEEITNALDDGKLPIVFHNNLVFTFFRQDDANNTILFTARYVNGDSTYVNIMDIILTVYEDNHVETTTLAYGINPAVMYSGITAEKVATYDGYGTTINGKADKATTLVGYGIGDAYTKTEVDSKLSSVYKYKGTVATVDALPSSGNIEGDVYNVESTGDNYAWVDAKGEVEAHWDKLAGVVDLSDLTLDSSLATIAKSGSYNDLIDKPTIDDALNKTSSNAVKNSAVATEIETIQTTIGSIAGNVQSNQQAIQSLISNKQATLVSGTNIRTINGVSLLGSGDITIESGESSDDIYMCYVDLNVISGEYYCNATYDDIVNSSAKLKLFNCSGAIGIIYDQSIGKIVFELNDCVTINDNTSLTKRLVGKFTLDEDNNFETIMFDFVGDGFGTLVVELNEIEGDLISSIKFEDLRRYIRNGQYVVFKDNKDNDIYTLSIANIDDVITARSINVVDGATPKIVINTIDIVENYEITNDCEITKTIEEYNLGGASVTVDTELSTTSENPIQNKIITTKINTIENNLTNNYYTKNDIDDVLGEIQTDVSDLNDQVRSIEEKVPNNASSTNKLVALSDLEGKQNNLSNTQLLAVNSGITASKVSTYDGYATSKQDALPSQSGKEGMFLGTDGSNLLWRVSEGSYQAPLFSFQWSDHLLNDASWLRADTFSWQDGSVYSTAYDHLVADIQGISSTTTQIAGVSISVYTASDGHKIVMSDQETAVQNIYNASGVAWFYILDTTNHRFKLPRTKYGFTGLRTNVGEYVAPGLPNIRGSIQSNNWAGTASSNSALYPSGNGENSRAEGSGPNTISFDASRSSPIYGASTTVQPPATQMYLYFYIGNFTQTALAQTAGLNTELFNNKADVSLVNSKADVSVVNNKADVNLSNVNPSATFKTTVVGWSFPDYTAGVSISSSYTAPSNGWIVVRTVGSDQYCYGGIDNAGYSVGGTFNNYHEDDTMFAPIRKGKVWTGSGIYTAVFYPCVGG